VLALIARRQPEPRGIAATTHPIDPRLPGLAIVIADGRQSGIIAKILAGADTGTLIRPAASVASVPSPIEAVRGRTSIVIGGIGVIDPPVSPGSCTGIVSGATEIPNAPMTTLLNASEGLRAIMSFNDIGDAVADAL